MTMEVMKVDTRSLDYSSNSLNDDCCVFGMLSGARFLLSAVAKCFRVATTGFYLLRGGVLHTV